MKHKCIFRPFTEGRIICSECGRIISRYKIDEKEIITQIKRHLKGIEKAVEKLEKE
jgi:hypothetical protein